jgi:hypothetical protein
MCAVLLVLLWVAFLWKDLLRVQGGGAVITSTLLTTLTPLLLGLVAVGVTLSRIVQLTLPGMKAELSQPHQDIAKGLIGSISFGAELISLGVETTKAAPEKSSVPQKSSVEGVDSEAEEPASTPV